MQLFLLHTFEQLTHHYRSSLELYFSCVVAGYRVLSSGYLVCMLVHRTSVDALSVLLLLKWFKKIQDIVGYYLLWDLIRPFIIKNLKYLRHLPFFWGIHAVIHASHAVFPAFLFLSFAFCDKSFIGEKSFSVTGGVLMCVCL